MSQLSREELAQAELGRTTVTPATARALTIAFLALHEDEQQKNGEEGQKNGVADGGGQDSSNGNGAAAMGAAVG